MNEFQHVMVSYNPQTNGEMVLAQEAFGAYNRYIVERRARLAAVNDSLPSVMWWVLVLSSLMVVAMTWLLPVKELLPHLLVATALSLFLGTLIFVVVSFASPFRSTDVGVSAQPIQLIYDQFMKR